MRPAKFILHGETQRESAKRAIDAAKPGQIVTISAKKRTTEQNALLHRWFADIATQKGDETLLDIKASCNLTYGRPIKVRDDPEWGAVFDHIFRGLNYEKKLKAIRIADVPFTRDMNVKQLSEYMDLMSRDYSEQGYILTNPSDLYV